MALCKFDRVVLNKQVALEWHGEGVSHEVSDERTRNKCKRKGSRPELHGVSADLQGAQFGWVKCLRGETGRSWGGRKLNGALCQPLKGLQLWLKLRQEAIRKLTTEEKIIWFSINRISVVVVFSKGGGKVLLIHDGSLRWWGYRWYENFFQERGNFLSLELCP